MKKLFLLFILAFGMSILGMGQAILYEDFNYTPPTNIGGNGNVGSSNNNWTTHSVVAGHTTTIDVVSGNLSYTGLAAPSGYKVYDFGNGNATDRDVNRAFTSTATVLYFSVLLNLIDNSGITTSGDYFMHFGNTSGSAVSSFGGRLGAKTVNVGANYRFIIQNTSGGSPTFTEFAQDCNFGTTYLVVVKYDRSVSPTMASLWVNPSSLGGTEPAGSVSNNSGTTAFSAFASICIRNNATTPKLNIDEIRVGATWASVTPTGSAGAPTHLAVTSVNGGVAPTAGVPFSVQVQSLDASNNLANVTSDCGISLSSTGIIGGMTTGTISNGQNTVTISGVTLLEGHSLTITATQTSGTPGLTAGTSAPFNVFAVNPNYHSNVGTGSWNAAASWQVQINGVWYDATDFPNALNKNVTILNGHTITVTDNTGKCKDLTIDAGGKVWTNNATMTAAQYLNVYGNITNNGTIGSSDNGVTPDNLGFDIEGASCLISGTGTFDAGRISKFTTVNATTNVTINMNVTLRYSGTYYAIAGFAGSTLNLTVNPGILLNVTTGTIDLTLCTLLLKSTASGTACLLNNGTIIGSTAANTTVERYFTGASRAWHLLSSPVASQAISPAFTVLTATEYDFFAWYEPTTGIWVNFKNTSVEPTWNTANGSTNFTVGKGYLVEYLAANPTKQFQGSLNTGPVSYALTNSGTGTNKGFNLAGNPYPSAIDWKASSGWIRTSLVLNGSGNDMSIWNGAAGNYGLFNSAGSSGTNGVTQYIPVGQGFMVKAASSGSLGMDNGIRVHNSQGFLKSSDEISNILRMKVSGDANTYSDEIVVEFGHQTAIGGAEKMFSFYETAPSLYTVKPTDNYSIDFRGEPGAVTIPVSFKAGVDGAYTLTASQLESFTSSTVITLDDLQAVKSQNLMQNPSYTFTATKNDGADRFQLHFGGAFSVNEKANAQPITIYASGSTVYISNVSGTMLKGEVIVYNMIGQPLIYQQLSENPLTKINLSGTTGYYLVKVITSDNTYSGKVFINK